MPNYRRSDRGSGTRYRERKEDSAEQTSDQCVASGGAAAPCSLHWCASIGRSALLTCWRVRLDTMLGKFWLISASRARGSDAAATRLAACRPASFTSHTWCDKQDASRQPRRK
jgi:hypothetical protein